MPNHRVNKVWPKSLNITVLETPCREYQGARDEHGYGRRKVGGKVKFVHRWIYEQIHGEQPPTVKVLHRCDNPPCFRYDHLFAGTNASNTADMVAKGRQTIGERNGQAKLTAEAVTEIRNRRQRGESLRSLSEAFEVAESAISRIYNRKRWGHT